MNSTLGGIGDFQGDWLEQKYKLKGEIVEVSEIMKEQQIELGLFVLS